jgi:hypothetical protein
MRFDIGAFDTLFMENFNGNYHEASRQLGVNVSQLHRILNKKSGIGLLFVERFMRWCKTNNVESSKYFFYADN